MQWNTVHFHPCLSWLTLYLVIEASPEGEQHLQLYYYPCWVTSQVHKSHEPFYKHDLYPNPFHQHFQDNGYPSWKPRELCSWTNKNLHTNLCILFHHNEWYLKNNDKSIKLSSRVANGYNFFSLSKLNYCLTARLKVMRYFLTMFRKTLGKNFI